MGKNKGKVVKVWKSIDIRKLDKLLEEYKDMKYKEESFSEFVEGTKDNNEYVWDLTDSIGVVSKGDFERTFTKEFIEKHFEDLAELWFKGLNSQVDLGIILGCIKEEAESRDDK